MVGDSKLALVAASSSTLAWIVRSLGSTTHFQINPLTCQKFIMTSDNSTQRINGASYTKSCLFACVWSLLSCTCFCAAILFWSLFLQAGSWMCLNVLYPVVIPFGLNSCVKIRQQVTAHVIQRNILSPDVWIFCLINLQFCCSQPSEELVVFSSPTPEPIGHSTALELPPCWVRYTFL